MRSAMRISIDELADNRGQEMATCLNNAMAQATAAITRMTPMVG
jgi:hypothetical protein